MTLEDFDPDFIVSFVRSDASLTNYQQSGSSKKKTSEKQGQDPNAQKWLIFITGPVDIFDKAETNSIG